MSSLNGLLSTSLSLLERARRKDPAAWHILCDLDGPLVYSWVRRAGVSPEDVPDIVQEVFRIVATHFDRFRGDRLGDTFRGWLMTLTKTEVLAFCRKRRREKGLGEGGSDANYRMQQLPDLSELTTESVDEPSERRNLVRRCAELIQRDFSPKVWQAFWRSVVEEHNVSNIAADLQMTSNAIRQARFRVLQCLREHLNQ